MDWPHGKEKKKEEDREKGRRANPPARSTSSRGYELSEILISRESFCGNFAREPIGESGKTEPKNN